MSLFEQATFALEKGTGKRSAREEAYYRHVTYTERLRSSLMALISIFLRPMVDRLVEEKETREERIK